MSTIVLLSAVLLALNIFVPIHSKVTNRTYLIKKDFLSDLKGGEFPVYDSTGKKQLYRMESKIGKTHNVQVFATTSKKVLAELAARVASAMYKGNIAVLDTNLKQWKNGTIEHGNKFRVFWNGQRISMEGKGNSLDTTFRDESNSNILAQFKKRGDNTNDYERYVRINGLARAAISYDKDYEKGKMYADELLAFKPQDTGYNSAVFKGNIFNGLVAFRRDKDVATAKRFLLAAGKIAADLGGSPTLNSFGPNMSLAKDLLEVREQETVLKYFNYCRKFWKKNILDEWTSVVKNGGIPDFGANLDY
ncbi:unnamed protein product [Didymodactylos carnosus]|uniref:Uncharacterized protein n=1 Tax=Didymodactylos carnosus TaxID=1234261 RepID=A0A814U6Q0_9BILA|nr:unnamed protein product [Didymodactylos carnosus]CAF3935559.1 unnamed protein product [Didymodactylos carnosus]